MRRFVGIDLGREPVPDETTVCHFHHLLEGQELGERLLDKVQRHLGAKGLKLAIGTIVDATIINAPSSCRKQNIGEEGAGHHTAIEKTFPNAVRVARVRSDPLDPMLAE